MLITSAPALAVAVHSLLTKSISTIAFEKICDTISNKCICYISKKLTPSQAQNGTKMIEKCRNNADLRCATRSNTGNREKEAAQVLRISIGRHTTADELNTAALAIADLLRSR